MADVANQFDEIIRSVIRTRRAIEAKENDDVTTQLCHDASLGRLLTEAELISIIRNCSGGDLGLIIITED